jgi:hypothetical protein
MASSSDHLPPPSKREPPHPASSSTRSLVPIVVGKAYCVMHVMPCWRGLPPNGSRVLMRSLRPPVNSVCHLASTCQRHSRRERRSPGCRDDLIGEYVGEVYDTYEFERRKAVSRAPWDW